MSLKHHTFVIFVCSLFFLQTIHAQTTITGKITDSETGEELIGANIVLNKDGVYAAGASTDFDGNYRITIDPGIYDIEVAYVGYANKRITEVVVKAGQTTRLDIEIGGDEGVLLDEVVVTSYKMPLIDLDFTTSGSVVTSDQMRNVPRRNIRGLAAKSAGIRTFKSKRHHKAQNKEEIAHESYGILHENDFSQVAQNPLSTFSVDVDAASYSNVRRHLTAGNLPPKDAVRIEELINYFDYDYPLPKGVDPFSVNHELTACPWNKDHLLLQVGLKGQEIESEKLPASNIVFLIDVSGSMNSRDKLPLLKSSLRMLTEKLRPNDKVAMVVYAGSSGLVLPSTSCRNKKSILAALNNLSAGGSTAGGAGLKLAYKVANENFIKNGNNRIVLATDGDFNVGLNSNAEMERLIIKEREKGVAISVLGFGTGNIQDDKMEIIADKGNGNYAYIDNLKEAQKVLVKEFGGTLFTIAKDVKFQLEFNPATVSAYRQIGYINRKLNEEDFKDDKKDAGEIGSGHTVTALYEIVPAKNRRFKTRLKYQDAALTNAALISNDLITLKLRYKLPKKSKSNLIEFIVKKSRKPLAEASDNFRFAASVASFGMLLRQSKYLGEVTWDTTLALAEGAMGADKEGYRQEFIGLVSQAKELAQAEGLLGKK